MKYYMTEEEAVYMQAYHGHFSRKLALWAIGKMKTKDTASGDMKPVTMKPLDDVLEILHSNDVKVQDECVFDAWYLYHMAVADYQKTLPTDKHRALYVEETLNDPDGDTTDVLACFEAKMCNAGVPIYWERFV